MTGAISHDAFSTSSLDSTPDTVPFKTEIVAWWGAILATIVFIWDIYKWKMAGAKLRVTVQSNMESINIPQYDGKTLIAVNVVNYGDRPTTITNLGFLWFENLWNRIRRRPDKAFIIPNPSQAQVLPFELKQGNLWSGIAVQDVAVEAMARDGLLYCVLYHTHTEKPVYRRLRIPKKKSVV